MNEKKDKPDMTTKVEEMTVEQWIEQVHFGSCCGHPDDECDSEKEKEKEKQD